MDNATNNPLPLIGRDSDKDCAAPIDDVGVQPEAKSEPAAKPMVRYHFDVDTIAFPAYELVISISHPWQIDAREWACLLTFNGVASEVRRDSLANCLAGAHRLIEENLEFLFPAIIYWHSSFQHVDPGLLFRRDGATPIKRRYRRRQRVADPDVTGG